MVGLAAPTHPPIVAHCNQGGAVNTPPPPHSLAGGQLRDLTRMVQIFLFPRIHHRPGAFIIETLVICYDTRPRWPAVTSSATVSRVTLVLLMTTSPHKHWLSSRLASSGQLGLDCLYLHLDLAAFNVMNEWRISQQYGWLHCQRKYISIDLGLVRWAEIMGEYSSQKYISSKERCSLILHMSLHSFYPILLITQT